MTLFKSSTAFRKIRYRVGWPYRRGAGASFPEDRGRARRAGPSAPIPKFVSYCGKLVYELRNQRSTSKSMILVRLLDLKFLYEIAGPLQELQIRRARSTAGTCLADQAINKAALELAKLRDEDHARLLRSRRRPEFDQRKE